MFLLNALIGGLVGVQHLLAPRLWTDLAGMQIVETVTWRVIGAALIGFAVGSWLAAQEETYNRVRTLVVMQVIWTTVAAATIAWGILFEGIPPLEWLNVAVLGAFGLAFARYLVRYEVARDDETTAGHLSR